jgi:fumarate hydratase subunit alpha
LRELSAKCITDTIADLCGEANLYLPQALSDRIAAAAAAETDALPRQIMGTLQENLQAAASRQLPICQDCGMAVVFAELGQEVHITGGGFEEAIHAGVAKGYKENFLRCSIVADPLRRVNTGNNTPAVIHLRIVPGNTLHLDVCPKGFGSENMSRLQMLTPAADKAAIAAFVLETVRLAGSNPCPPMTVGVGIGGNFETVALLAKKALVRDPALPNADPYYAAMEAELLAQINATGIGPQGFGGKTTALTCAIEAAPTHIAGLPVAVNIGCHVNRHAAAIL